MNTTDFLIIGEPVTFSLSVQPAMNYPLDLYLLMDLSISLRNVLSNVQALASDIGKYLYLYGYLFCKGMDYGIGGANGQASKVLACLA